jgi:hypothetical protein
MYFLKIPLKHSPFDVITHILKTTVLREPFYKKVPSDALQKFSIGD